MRVHMRKGSVFTSLAVATATAAALSLAACGGNSASSTTPPATGSPAIISVGDAPMSSVLAALVTVSDVTITPTSGSPIHLLSQSRIIELTHLGGIRAPLDVHTIPQGTYSSLSLTVTAATITYLNNGAPTTVNATLGTPATATIQLNPALNVDDNTSDDIRFDFDLSKSLDLTNNVVTFTPSISAAAVRVKGEGKDDRVIYVNGTVTAVSTTNNTITLQQRDTGLSVTLNVNNQTKFDDNESLSSIQVGAVIHTVDQLQSDGTLVALAVGDTDGGQNPGSGERVDNGLVLSVARDSSNNLTSFTMVVRESISEDNEGKVETVEVSSSGTTPTAFKITDRATAAGMSLWDQTQVFPGSGVWVRGTTDTTATLPSEVAAVIRPAQVNPFGLSSAAVVVGSTSGSFTIPLLLDANTFFNKAANITALSVNTNSNTVYDGNGLSSANVASLGIGTPLVARGFLTISTSSASLFCSHLHEEGGASIF